MKPTPPAGMIWLDCGPEPGPVSWSDAAALVWLLGQVIAIRGDMGTRRHALMAGICHLTGAHGWAMDERPMVLPAPGESGRKALQTRPHLLLFPLSPAGSGILSLYRRTGGAGFTARDQHLARILLEEIPWLSPAEPEPEIMASEPDLPPRELRIFALLRQGWDRKRIATVLELSPETVASYQKNIYRRLEVHSQVELMQRYRQQGPEKGRQG